MNTKKRVYEALSRDVKRVKLSIVDEISYAYSLLEEDLQDYDTDISRLDGVADDYEAAKGQLEIYKEEFTGQFKELDVFLERFEGHQFILRDLLSDLEQRANELGLSVQEVLPEYNEISDAINNARFEEKLTATILNTAASLNLI